MLYNFKMLEEIRLLIEDYMVSFEIGNHRKLAELSSKICSQIIQILDHEIQEACEYDESTNENLLFEKNELTKIINSICLRLRVQSMTGYNYANVLDFVGAKDMICFSDLIGASQDSTNKSSVDNFGSLACTLRQSIALLKQFQVQSSSTNSESWIDRGHIRCTRSISFPTYHLTTNQITIQRLDNTPTSQLIDQYKSTELETRFPKCEELILSQWFAEFLSSTLEEPYPLDRFSILVSILIIANECGSEDCVSYINELIDQIYHEEVSSLNEDDLMQLRQTGSFWFSHYKRYKVTIKQKSDQFKKLNQSDSLDSDSELDSLDSRAALILDQGKHDWKASLRKIINEELMFGVRCTDCNFKPDELFGPVNRRSCPNCGLEDSTEKCSLSLKPLELISLGILKTKQPVEQLTLLSPSSWLRQMVSIKLKPKLQQFSDLHKTEISERVDISKNFERLTMIRSQNNTNSGKCDNGLSSDEEEGSLTMQDDNDYQILLRRFMKNRSKQVLTVDETDSIQMLKFIKDFNYVKNLPLLLSDFLLMDQHDNRVKLCLIKSNNLLEHGSLWCCQERSAISELVHGCRRIFCSLELVRLGQNTLVSGFTCPFCGHLLIELRRLSEQLV